MGRKTPHITMMRTVGGMALLGVQLDDEMHSDIEVDICLGGQSNNLTLEGVLITIQPLGGSNESIVFLQLLEESVGGGFLGNSDHIANLDQVAGDVDMVAVDGEVAVVHQLASLAAGIGEAQTVHDVVQPALAVGQQHLTGVALGAGGLVVVVPELLLLDTVNKFDLLLLGQLSGVLRLLRSSLAAGVLVGSLVVTHRGRRNAQRSATLQHGLHILSHNANSSSTLIRHDVSWEDGSHCEEWESRP